ncbi:MAG: hypothetical protein ACYC6L_08545 [Anaerolineae bacterium]
MEPTERYKLFTDANIRKVVLYRLEKQLIEKYCPPTIEVCLALAIGKVASGTDRNGLHQYFTANKWILYDDLTIASKLATIKDSAYEDEVAYVATKLALRQA